MFLFTRQEADIAVGALVINNITRQFVDFTEAFLSLRYSALLAKPKKSHYRRGHKTSRERYNLFNATAHSDRTGGGGGYGSSVDNGGGYDSGGVGAYSSGSHKSGSNGGYGGVSGVSSGSGSYSSSSSGSDDDDLIIRDAKQLVESGISVGVVRDSLAQQLLAQSSLPEHRVLFSRLAQSWPTAFARNRHEGIARARAEKYAFIIDTPIAEYEAGKQPCDVYTTEPFLELVEYGIVMRKGAMIEIEKDNGSVVKVPLKDEFDEEMRKMKGGDEMQTMYLKWWKDECVGTERVDVEDRVVGMVLEEGRDGREVYEIFQKDRHMEGFREHNEKLDGRNMRNHKKHNHNKHPFNNNKNNNNNNNNYNNNNNNNINSGQHKYDDNINNHNSNHNPDDDINNNPRFSIHQSSHKKKPAYETEVFFPSSSLSPSPSFSSFFYRSSACSIFIPSYITLYSFSHVFQLSYFVTHTF